MTVAGMFRLMWRAGSQRFFRLQTTAPHIGDLKPLKMFIEVLSCGQSASLLFRRDHRRKMGATMYIGVTAYIYTDADAR